MPEAAIWSAMQPVGDRGLLACKYRNLAKVHAWHTAQVQTNRCVSVNKVFY